MSAAERVPVKQTIAAACLPIVCVDSWIILTAEEAGPELRRFLELANDWESPFVRVYGGPLAEEPGYISVEWEKYWHPEIQEAQVALPQHLKVLREWTLGWQALQD